LRHADAVGAQHAVERTDVRDLHLLAGLGADHHSSSASITGSAQTRRVEQRLVGADRAEILPQARARLIAHREMIGDHVEIGIALALAHLRPVHAVQLASTPMARRFST
jgi:predicted DNA-binding helix-hairpin-helix protein